MSRETTGRGRECSTLSLDEVSEATCHRLGYSHRRLALIHIRLDGLDDLERTNTRIITSLNPFSRPPACDKNFPHSNPTIACRDPRVLCHGDADGHILGIGDALVHVGVLVDLVVFGEAGEAPWAVAQLAHFSYFCGNEWNGSLGGR